MKGPAEKNFEGIYANPRFMHAAGMIVGCIVQVQVKNGATFEGVLRTFSHKADFVLEMPRKIDSKKPSNSAGSNSNPVTGIPNSDEVTEKMIFRFDDVVTLNAHNVDPEYATRESFTDTAISKFNGQVVEKELEPWDGGSISADSLPDLGGGDEEANGWDANDMFRTNEEKYGVKSSFDSNLPGYTIPLNKQNTEEYKQQEARASKLANEIESASHHKSRAALENGDEEDRYSAVIRPTDNTNNNNNNNFRYVSHRNRKPVTRSVRNSAPPPHHTNRNSHQHPSLFRVSSPASAVTNSQGSYKMVSSMSAPSCVSALSPRPSDSTPTSRQSQIQQNQLPLQPPAATQYPSPVPVTNTTTCVTPLVPHTNTPLTPTVPQGDENPKINGEAEKAEIKFTPKPPRSLNLQSAANKEVRDITNQQASNKTADRRKDVEKKQLGQKAREDKTEDLKRFHSKFKLEDPKDAHDIKDVPKSDVQTPVSTPSSMPSTKTHKDKSKDDERKIESIPENRGSPDNPKSSTLNPNAKEFVFNPNAKTFTPRSGMPVQQNAAPPPVQPPPRLHTQSPIMAMPQHHLIPGMPQTVFNVAPHYVVSATPVSMPMAPPFTSAASVTQAPRFRKAMPIMHRQDLSQPVHVQAATGQPILAQPTLSAPQFAIQYAPSPGMLHPPGPPQQLAYAQMYSLMPRVLTPQPVGMVPTSAAYNENPQIPTHVYMHPGTPSLQHPMASANSGQHSAPSTPQSQTPNLHPAPSPVHQPPPSGTHGQPPTPTGHPSNAPTPQPVMYAHGHMTTQHPLHANHSSSNQGHPFAASYAGTPQPIVLLPQQPHAPHPATFAAAASSLPNHHLHGQTPGSHVGTPTHVLPHAQMAMIPTSAAMVHTPTAAISTGHYVPHSQV